MPVLSDGPLACQSGAFSCLIGNLQEYSRLVDELTYQLNASDTLNFSISDIEGISSSDNDFNDHLPTSTEDLRLELCQACAKTVPVELEECLQKWRLLLLDSISSLKSLRNLCSKLRKKLGLSNQSIVEKTLHISQLEEAVKHLGKAVHFNSRGQFPKTLTWMLVP